MRDIEEEITKMNVDELDEFFDRWFNWLEENPEDWGVDENGKAYAKTTDCPPEALYVADNLREAEEEFERDCILMDVL